MHQQPDPGHREKEPLGNGILRTATELFPWPMRWVGSFIFFTACLGSILYLLIGMVLTHTSQNDALASPEFTYFQFETVAIFLRIAAVGLVLAALSGERNGLVVVIGILLVGALIVPTKDMMRMYLAATNSTRDIEEFYGDSGGGPELRGRDPQLAATIVDVLDQAGALNSDGDTMRADLYWLVEEEIVQERVTTLLERTRARGALEVLERIQANEVLEIRHRYGEDERHIATLRFLRNASLVTYTYDDLVDLDVTQLGLRVLHQARIDGFSALRLPEAQSPLFKDCLPLGFDEPVYFVVGTDHAALDTDNRMTPDTDGSTSTSLDQKLATPNHRLRLGARSVYAIIDVRSPDHTAQDVLVSVQDARAFQGKLGDLSGQEDQDGSATSPQPVLELFQVFERDAAGDRKFADCKVVGTASAFRANGPSGADSNNPETITSVAAVGGRLAPGRYVLKIHDRQQTRGRVSLSAGLKSDLQKQVEVSLDNSVIELLPRPVTMSCDAFDQSHQTATFQNGATELSFETTLTNADPTNYQIDVEPGRYSVLVDPGSGSADPTLMAQMVREESQPCRDTGWEFDDDSGPGALGSALTMSVSDNGQLLISVAPFYQESTGSVTISVVKVD